MKKKVQYRFLLSAILLLGVLLSGCSIFEDNTDCPHPFRLFIKAHDADGKDITADGDVTQVILFVFNEKQEIVDVVTVSDSNFRNGVPVNVELDYPGHQSLTFVAWGNVGSKIEFPESIGVKQWSDLYAKLLSQNGVAQSPDALFYGNLTVPVEFGGIEPVGDQTVIMTHRTAQVVITAINLKKFNENKEGKYEYRLKESYDNVDKDGNHTGGPVHYIPLAEMDANGTLNAPVFNTFPQIGATYTLEILFNGEVIYTATQGTDGVQFIPELGRMLNIILDFRSGVSIKVVVTPWNVVYQYVEI